MKIVVPYCGPRHPQNPLQVLGGVELPDGYANLWSYYGTMSFYARQGEDRHAATAEKIRLHMGWPKYNPNLPEPKDPVWADTPHARAVKKYGLEWRKHIHEFGYKD